MTTQLEHAMLIALGTRSHLEWKVLAEVYGTVERWQSLQMAENSTVRDGVEVVPDDESGVQRCGRRLSVRG